MYVFAYKDGRTTLIDLASGTGTVKWKRAITDGQWIIPVVTGEVYVAQNNYLEKVNPDDGGKLWSYAGNRSNEAFYLDWNEAGILYLTQGQELRRLDATTGATLWSYTTPAPQASLSTNRYTLKNGDLILITINGTSNSAHVVMMNADGKKLWETDPKFGNAYALEDSSGNIYYVATHTVYSVNRATGAIKWTFARETAVQNETVYTLQTYGDDIFLLYGGPSGRYPPMGISRLDAKTGALQWDVWVGEATSLILADSGFLFTNRVMGLGAIAYKR